MQILIIDGQGGGVGRSLAERLAEHGLSDSVIVAGTNAVATSNMMKAGVLAGATGENAVVFNCRAADLILGPMGIILPDAMYGEITAAMAAAVVASPAKKILLPVQNMALHPIRIVGVEQKPLSVHVEAAVRLALAETGRGG